MYGAKPFTSTLIRRAWSASQCASSPSPSEVARPIPVIQTSADPEFEDFVSIMGHQFLGKSNAPGHGVHVHAQIRMREGDLAKGDRCVASQLTGDAYLRGCDG